MRRTRKPWRTAVVWVGWLSSTACHVGTAYVGDGLLLCSGPGCPSSCSTNSDCPTDYTCIASQCYTSAAIASQNSGSSSGSSASSTTGSLTGLTTTGTGGLTGASGTTTSSIPCTPNACGDCLPNCFTDNFGSGTQSGNGNVTFGNTNHFLPPPGPGEQVLQDPNGAITLAASTNTPTLVGEFAWVANTHEGTVSLVDTYAHKEVGRYASVTRYTDANGNLQPQVSDWYTQCNQPSRTAVDPNRDLAFVANRNNMDDGNDPSSGRTCQDAYQSAYSGNANTRITTWQPALLNWDQGSITKIGRYDPAVCNNPINPNNTGCACYDRNQDGTILTSRDINLDGAISLATSCSGACSTSCRQDSDCTSGSQPYCFLGVTNDHLNTAGYCSTSPQEFFGYADECVMWTFVLPRPPGSRPPSAQNYYSPASQFGPKMRAITLDKGGNIWAGDYRWKLMYKIDSTGLNPNSGALLNPNSSSPMPAPYAQSSGVTVQLNPYGAVIDPNGIIAISSNNGHVDQVDSTTGLRTTGVGGGLLYSSDNLGSYGITIDAQQRIWVAAYGVGSYLPVTPQVGRYTRDTNTWTAIPCGDTNNPTNNPGCANAPGWGPYDTFDYSAGTGNGCPFNANAYINAPSNANNVCFGWRGRGVTTDVLDDGNVMIWATYNNGYTSVPNRPGGWLLGFDGSSGAVLVRVRTDIDPNVPGFNCTQPIGVGIGANHQVLVVGEYSNTLCSFNPTTGWEPTLPVGVSPYTYSDFTGNLFTTFTKPTGTYSIVVEACPSSNYALQAWQSVTLTATTPGTAPYPNSATIQVAVQTASSPSNFNGPVVTLTPTLDYSQSEPYTYPLSLSAQQNTQSWMQLSFTLTEGQNQDLSINIPKLYDVQVARKCILVGGG